MINGLLAPTSGLIFMQQNPIGAESKKHISYLPDHTYLNMTILRDKTSAGPSGIDQTGAFKF